MLAQGVPLLLAGDEVANNQNGNNNAYCQDNPIGWVDWSRLGQPGDDLSALVALLTALRRRFPQLRPRRWMQGHLPDGSFDVLWLTPNASEMSEQDWKFPEGRFLSYVLNSPRPGEGSLYIALNAATDAIAVKLPHLAENAQWSVVLDTAASPRTDKRFAPGATVQAAPRSVLVFAGLL
jgi:glycogen operon protein